MRRLVALLLAGTFGMTCLPSCGDAPSEQPTLRTAEAPLEQTPSQHPQLKGRSVRRASAATSGHATVNSQAQISVPAGASWGSVKKALETSAGLRRKPARVSIQTPVSVPLPGLPGYVIVGSQPRTASVRLALRLRDSRHGRSTRVDTLGVAWIAKLGCDASVHWEAEGWSLKTWQAALARLKGLGAATEHGLRVRADDSVPAAQVLAFLTAASTEGYGALWIETRQARRFYDPTDEALRWLAAHQMPSGAWDVNTAASYCDGHLLDTHVATVGHELPEQAGLTGLVLCSFLGAGYSNRGKHPFARVVSRGLRYLKTLQRQDGVFRTHSQWSDATAHGWATLALVQAFGLTASPIYKGPAQRGLDALEPTWRRSGNDALATVLAALALRLAQHINSDAARRSKTERLTLPLALAKALRADAQTHIERGSNFGIAAGLLTRLRVGDDPATNPDMGAAAIRLREAFVAAEDRSDPGLTWLTSLTNYHVPGSRNWKPMTTALHKHLIGRERKGGHVCCFRGSWDPQPDPSMPGGRVAATALHCLTLELFYRYDSPLFRR